MMETEIKFTTNTKKVCNNSNSNLKSNQKIINNGE